MGTGKVTVEAVSKLLRPISNWVENLGLYRQSYDEITLRYVQDNLTESFKSVWELLKENTKEESTTANVDAETAKAKIENEDSKPVKEVITPDTEIIYKAVAKKENPELQSRLDTINEEIKTITDHCNSNISVDAVLLNFNYNELKALHVDAAVLCELRKDPKAAKDHLEKALFYSRQFFIQLKLF